MNPTDYIPDQALKEIASRIHSQELLLAYAILMISAALCVLGFYFGYRLLSGAMSKRDDTLTKFKDDTIGILSKFTEILTKIVTTQELDHDSVKTNRELLGDISECMARMETCVKTITPTLQGHIELCRNQYEKLMGRE